MLAVPSPPPEVPPDAGPNATAVLFGIALVCFAIAWLISRTRR